MALDLKTGKVAWDHLVANPKAGYGITGGPLVVAGKVMVGTLGRAPGGNLIVALDAQTGAEAWKFHVIPQPGQPGDSTWNATPVEKRNGGSVWIPGSYDAAHNLVFFAPGNTYDTAPLRNLVKQPGITNDGLYLDTTLALSPTDGRLAWSFQHQANGQWDLDWAFERQIMQLPVNGRMETVVLTAGKQMIYDLVEAETGKYLSSFDLGKEAGLQNVVTGIDPKTGAKSVDESLVPGDGMTKTVCPHVDGGRDWMPTSYDSATKLLFIPAVRACMDLVPVRPGASAAACRPACAGPYVQRRVATGNTDASTPSTFRRRKRCGWRGNERQCPRACSQPRAASSSPVPSTGDSRRMTMPPGVSSGTHV